MLLLSMDLEQIEHHEIIYELESRGFFNERRFLKKHRFLKYFKSGNYMIFTLNKDIMYLSIMNEENYFNVYQGIVSIDSVSKLINLIETNTFVFSVILEILEGDRFINNILLDLIEYEIDTLGFPRIYMKIEEGYCSLYCKLEN